MPALKADLPDHLYWLTEKVEGLVRPGAFLVDNGKEVARRGATFTCSLPDAPLGAAWASLALRKYWCQSPYDGESCYLQLNLEDVPAEVRAQLPTLPAEGMVWVTIDLSDGWKGHAYFDPRAARDIAWHPRPHDAVPPRAQKFVLQDTLTCCTDVTLPEISADYHGGVGMCVDYDDWWQTHYGGRHRSEVQLGGWIHPIQGDMDHERETLVLAIEQQEFGDSGAIYLHYSVERGFFVHVETH